MIGLLSITLFLSFSRLASAMYENMDISRNMMDDHIFMRTFGLHDSRTLELVCPKVVNGVEFTWYPSSLPSGVAESEYAVAVSHTLVGSYQSYNLHYVPLRTIIGTVSQGIFTYFEDDEGLHLVIKYPDDGILVARDYDDLAFFCMPKGVDLRDLINKFTEWNYRTETRGPLTTSDRCERFEMFVNGFDPNLLKDGITIIQVYFAARKVTHGCSNVPSHLFVNEQTVDQTTGIPQCVIDVEKHPDVGFYCDGTLDPPDCFNTMHIEGEDGAKGSFDSEFTWKVGNLTLINMPRGQLLVPFRASCNCIKDGAVAAKLILTKSRVHECDLASMLMQDKLVKRSGLWCDISLKHDEELVLKFPLENCSQDIDNFSNYDGTLSNLHRHDTADQPCCSILLPVDATRDAKLHSILYDKHHPRVVLKSLLDAGVLHIDQSKRASDGVVRITYNNHPRRPYFGVNMIFVLVWLLRCRNLSHLDVTARILVRLEPAS